MVCISEKDIIKGEKMRKKFRTGCILTCLVLFCSITGFAKDLPDGTYDVNVESEDDSVKVKSGKLVVSDGEMTVYLDSEKEEKNRKPVEPVETDLKDGEYSVSVDMEGGSGKAFVNSPSYMIVRDGKAYARLEWSSSNYDYMIVGTEKYLNLSEEGENSSFEIPIACWDENMEVVADTTAMGTPHEVSYTLWFYEDSIGNKGQMPQEAAKRVVIFAFIIILSGGILNHFLKKRRK